MVDLRQVEFVVLGAGGLGCPALLGLAAAGAERLTIIDPDVVEASNLQRQVLYATADVGMAKVAAARWALLGRRRDLRIETRQQRVQPGDLDTLLANLPRPAVVLECTDAPPVKFAANDACLRRDVPLVIGAALGMRGQVMSIRGGHACYRCIYEDLPEQAQTCAAAGVLGPVVGTIGAMMAAHAVALARGHDETAGCLTSFDGLHGTARHLQPALRPGCSAHPPHPTNTRSHSSRAAS